MSLDICNKVYILVHKYYRPTVLCLSQVMDLVNHGTVLLQTVDWNQEVDCAC